MPFNLLTEAWLPVRRVSGTDHIPPWQLTDRLETDPVLALNSPRPDFDAAMTEWLIGLVQTTLWGDLYDDRAWQRIWNGPPSPEALREKMLTFADCFELFSDDGPAFMQDLHPEELDKEVRVDKLFLEVAGQKAAFFIKEGDSPSLCPACAAAALHMLQTYAPAGGAGVRTGLRGGGPLSTIIQGKTLWHTVCANLLPERNLGQNNNHDAPVEFGIFPWMAATCVSAKGCKAVYPNDVHPLHMYWAMPRRMRLVTEDNDVPCAGCGSEHGPKVKSVRSRHHGNNYEGGWKHPLSPIRHDPKAGALSVKGSAFTGFRDWLGLVFNEPDTKHNEDGEEKVLREPAPVIQALKNSKRRNTIGNLRLKACGFDMNNMKALAWTDETMPVRLAEDDKALQEQESLAIKLVLCAEDVRKNLYAAASMALFDEKKDTGRGGGLVIDEINAEFWRSTQPVFDKAMCAFLDAPNNSDEELKRTYLRGLQAQSERIFNTAVASGVWDDTQLCRQAMGWRLLQSRIRWKSAKAWSILNIEPPQRAENPEPLGGKNAAIL